MGRLWIQPDFKVHLPIRRLARTALVEMQIPVKKGPENPPQINPAKPRRGRIPMMFIKTARARQGHGNLILDRTKGPETSGRWTKGPMVLRERALFQRCPRAGPARTINSTPSGRSHYGAALGTQRSHILPKRLGVVCFYCCCHGDITLTTTNNTNKWLTHNTHVNEAPPRWPGFTVAAPATSRRLRGPEPRTTADVPPPPPSPLKDV